MKNLNLSIFLLSMSVSVLAQENALSETWGQNLDLTIPSLEMQSTSVLDSRDKIAITKGGRKLLSSETYRQCPNRKFSEADRIHVKGKSDKAANEHSSHLELLTHLQLQIGLYSSHYNLQISIPHIVDST